MKKMLTALTALLMAVSVSACSSSEPQTETVGAWEKAEDGTITEELQEIFDKAAEGLTGVGYTPVELLETQLVSGTNYKFLCDAVTVVPDAEKRQAIVTVYQDLNGNVTITDIEDLGSGEEETDTSLANPWKVAVTMSEAENATGFEFSLPVVDLSAGAEIRYMVDDAMKIIEISFADEGGRIILRKGTGDEDISGDYNAWNEVRELTYGDLSVTVKGNDGAIHTAVWHDAEFSYAIIAEGGLDEQAVSALVSSITQMFEF